MFPVRFTGHFWNQRQKPGDDWPMDIADRLLLTTATDPRFPRPFNASCLSNRVPRPKSPATRNLPETPMPESPQETSLLVELDRRQNEVLAQLDELNERIEQLLGQCTSMRNAEFSSANM